MRVHPTSACSKIVSYRSRMSKHKKGEKKEAEVVPVEVAAPKIEYGTFVFPDNSRYEGDFETKDGRIFRQGPGTFTNGPEVFVGQWVNDKMNGDGEYKFCSGAVYKGAFKDGVFEGHGRYDFPDGASYEGGWLNNKMHGAGTYIDAEGVEWTGSFFNGLYDSGKTYISLRPSKTI